MGSLENCFLGVFSASVRMSVVIIFLLLVKPLITKKYTAKCRYYLWTIVIIGLLIPINLNTSLSIIHLPATQNIILRKNISNNEIKSTNINDIATIEKLDSNVLKSKNQKEISVLEIASLIWILGFAIYLSINIFKHLIFINTIKRWTYDDRETLLKQCLEQTKKELNIKSKIELKTCKIIQTPMLVGIINSKLLMPMNSFSEDEIIFILKHELTHFKRKDLLYKLIILMTNAVHWFNPMIYVMNKEISYECEESCDEAIMKSESISRRKLYGEMILKTMLENIKQKSALSTCFYGGKKEMIKRLKNIIDIKIKKNGVVVVCLIAIIMISSTFIFGVTISSKPNITTVKTADGESLKEENINEEKTTSKEIIEAKPDEKNDKDEITLNSDNPVDNNMGSNSKEDSLKDDFVQRFDGNSIDEEFCVKAYDNLDKSFIIPAE